MSRLQKKCIIALAATHGLLVLVLGSAFLLSPLELPRTGSMKVVAPLHVEAALHTEPVRQQTDIPAEFVAENTTGNTPLDRSIEKLINEMKFIAPFDRESQDLQRTYTIKFNLRPKSIG